MRACVPVPWTSKGMRSRWIELIPGRRPLYSGYSHSTDAVTVSVLALEAYCTLAYHIIEAGFFFLFCDKILSILMVKMIHMYCLTNFS